MVLSLKKKVQVVWFKRDLRVLDNAVIHSALKEGPVILLYILETDFWQEPDVSSRQFDFLIECLLDLRESLAESGAHLVIKVGDAVKIFNELSNLYHIDSIWSHEEVWNKWVLARNSRVRKWCLEQNICWNELAQNGVVHQLENRDGWASLWYRFMSQDVVKAPDKMKSIDVESDSLPSSKDLGLVKDICPQRQKGGRSKGIECLDSFLHNRGRFYSKEMSSPVTAYRSCSRLSPHIAFGTLSIREVYQACQEAASHVKAMPIEDRGGWLTSLRSFSSRLRWHCHFIQKLADEPRIEFENLHSAYDNIRDHDNIKYFSAWKNGMTGYPMVDACMRSLHHTGWINFRMRAMLVSFASYHLWLDWREPSLYLAKQFTDYEPGIHYNQFQMQSGTTGMNTLRIYNPIKQSQDHDPDGQFIKQWIPELQDMPIEFIHTPWECPEHMRDYPLPIVDEKAARERAKKVLYGIRGSIEHKAEAKVIYKKHGSRKRPSNMRKKPKNTE